MSSLFVRSTKSNMKNHYYFLISLLSVNASNGFGNYKSVIVFGNNVFIWFRLQGCIFLIMFSISENFTLSVNVFLFFLLNKVAFLLSILLYKGSHKKKFFSWWPSHKGFFLVKISTKKRNFS